MSENSERYGRIKLIACEPIELNGKTIAAFKEGNSFRFLDKPPAIGDVMRYNGSSYVVTGVGVRSDGEVIADVRRDVNSTTRIYQCRECGSWQQLESGSSCTCGLTRIDRLDNVDPDLTVRDLNINDAVSALKLDCDKTNERVYFKTLDGFYFVAEIPQSTVNYKVIIPVKNDISEFSAAGLFRQYWAVRKHYKGLPLFEEVEIT